MSEFLGFIKLSRTSYDERSLRLTFGSLEEVNEYKLIMKSIEDLDELDELDEFFNSYEFTNIDPVNICDLKYNWNLVSLEDESNYLLTVDEQDWFEQLDSGLYKKL